jgi:hypothetical protein
MRIREEVSCNSVHHLRQTTINVDAEQFGVSPSEDAMTRSGINPCFNLGRSRPHWTFTGMLMPTTRVSY